METEEEQVEKVKAWLKENGMSIVLGVVIGVGGLLGYRYWTQYQETQAERASDHFSQMMDALSAGNQDSVQINAAVLVADYADTDYALMAHLALARGYVAEGDFDKAEAELSQVADSGQPLAYIARTRLALVQMQRQRYDQALATLAAEFPPEFEARVEELRGDIFARQGKLADAAAAYRKAQGAEPGPANLEFLQQKLDDLGSTG